MKTASKLIVGLCAMMAFVATACFDEGEDIPDFNEQLEKDILLIDDYLETNNVQNVIEHSSGIRYVLNRDSVGGKKITIDSCVTVDYVGKLMVNGLKFDDGTGISFPISSVIDGWKIGIPLLNEGDSATLYIPSGFAYGYYGYPPEIPSNANLIFHVAVRKVGDTYKASDRSCN